MPDAKEIGFFVGFVFLFIIFLVGFGAPYWVTDTGYNQGLWKICVSGICGNIGSLAADYLKATQAMMCLGLISFLVAAAASVVRLIQQPEGIVDLVKKVAPIATIIGGGFGVLACIIFWGYLSNELKVTADGWALILSCLSSILMLIHGIVNLVM